jgi:hypothetical protein
MACGRRAPLATCLTRLNRREPGRLSAMSCRLARSPGTYAGSRSAHCQPILCYCCECAAMGQHAHPSETTNPSGWVYRALETAVADRAERPASGHRPLRCTGLCGRPARHAVRAGGRPHVRAAVAASSAGQASRARRRWGTCRSSRRISASSRPTWSRCARRLARRAWSCCSSPGAATRAMCTCRTTTTRTPCATQARACGPGA